MRTLTKMLVVVDTRKDNSIALNRARLIAKATDTPIVALAPNPHPDATTQARLDAMLKPLQDDGIDVTGSELWHNNAVETIIHMQQRERCSLVIKAPKKTRGIAALVSTPEDWTLLRQCRAPVLLVHHDKSWMNGRVLAAVDACPNDSSHDVLNSVILEYAAAIASLSDSDCHLGSAHPGPMLSGEDTVQTAHDRYENKCVPMGERIGIPEELVHVEEGPAETFIPDLAKRIDASLIVMGTVANTHLKGALLGNTAEQILGLVETDVLTLKPRDLMDPLETMLK